MSTSEAKRQASRNNGKKSRGPKTDEGKEISKKNALKHGLSGEGVVVPDSLKEEVEQRVAEWNRALRPKEGPETWLVRRAATSSVRIDAAVRCESARRGERVREETCGDLAKATETDRAEELGRRLVAGKTEAGKVARELRSFVAGCDWMIAQWSELLRTTRAQQCWIWGDYVLAQRLIGKDHLTHVNDLQAAILAIDYWLARPEKYYRAHQDGPVQYAATWKASELPVRPSNSMPTPADRQQAMTRLEGYGNHALSELRKLRDQLQGRDDRSRDETANRVLVDLSPDGTLLRRYETDLDRLVYNALRQFEKIRKLKPDPDLPENDITPDAQPPASRNEPEPPADAPSAPVPALSRNEPETPAEPMPPHRGLGRDPAPASSAKTKSAPCLAGAGPGDQIPKSTDDPRTTPARPWTKRT